MESPKQRTDDRPAQSVDSRELNSEADFTLPLQPITEFITRPDFPECTLGKHIDIGGFTGVVVAIVKQSLRVRSPEGATRGFNSFSLRRIYAPSPEHEPSVSNAPAIEEPEPESKPVVPPREEIPEPDFNQPIIPIAQLVPGLDFPKSALGKHVEIGGYTGVVVEIVNQSLKVRSPQGTSRNYNAAALRNIYGTAKK
jgi:hypothetical protein